MPSDNWTGMIQNLGEKYGKLEEHPFISPKLAAYLTGDLPGTIPAEFKKLYLEELPKMMYRKGYAESHPQEALDLAASVLGAGTPFAETGEATVGMVKGLGKGTPEAKAIRKIMADELRARKMGAGESSISPEGTRWLEENPWFGDVLRGTWYHGRRSYPERGMNFAGARERPTNLGEPGGISLSASPRVAERFAKDTGTHKTKVLQKIDLLRDKLEEKMVGMSHPDYWDIVPKVNRQRYNLQKTKEKLSGLSSPLGRTFPRYGGPPEAGILPAWKKPGTEWAQRILADAYKEAAKKTMRIHGDKFGYIKGQLARTDVPPEDVRIILRNFIKDSLGQYPQRETFNKIFTEELRDKGVKGILYSPSRFGEQELRLLNPNDVMMLDKRRTRSVFPGKTLKKGALALDETAKSSLKEPWKRTLPMNSPDASLREIYKERVDLLSLAREVFPESFAGKATTKAEIGLENRLNLIDQHMAETKALAEDWLGETIP